MKTAILVTRSFDRFSELLAQADLEVINFEAIKTFPLENLNDLEDKLANLESYDGMIFTSPKAAEIFLNEFDKERNTFHGKVYILGNRTRTLFEKTNFKVIFRENVNTAEEFIKSFDKAEFIGKKLLFLRGDKSLRTIPELLKSVAEVAEVVVYRTIENPIDDNLSNEINEKIAHEKINWICFFSPSGIESFVNKFGKCALSKLKIAAIGTTTANKAAAENLKVDFISPQANAEDFALGLINHIKNIE